MRWEAANTFGKDTVPNPAVTDFLAEGLDRADPRQQSPAKCDLSRRLPTFPARRCHGGTAFRFASPRVDLHELEDAGDANWCCGGGGGVALINRAQPLREKAFEIKQRQMEATGMDRLY